MAHYAYVFQIFIWKQGDSNPWLFWGVHWKAFYSTCRTSDKHLNKNCGFLEKLLPGSLVTADMGFTFSESVGPKHAKLVIPVFIKGLKQLDPIDVEETRGISNVRIHVERVMGLLRRKYTILEGILPTDFLSSNHCGTLDYQVPLIDRILLMIVQK